MIKKYLHHAIAAAFLLASGTGNLAIAEVVPINEAERLDPKVRNDPIGYAQPVMLGTNGCAEGVIACVAVSGAIGLEATGGNPVRDVDFYSFLGRKGDVMRIDIDGGMKDAMTMKTLRSLDAMIAIFKPDGTVLMPKNDVLESEVDKPGSISRFDPHIQKIRLPEAGVYAVGVTSDARYVGGTMRVFVTGGATAGSGGDATGFLPTAVSNGRYTLIIELVEAGTLQISIDIKPGATSIAPFNPKSKGKIPVALLSHKDPNDPSKDFEAVKADLDSIKFGPTGTEVVGRCGRGGEDVNGDGLLDLVCHFESQDLHFVFHESETEGKVTGTIKGMPFEGSGWLKIVPMKTKDD